MWREGSYQDVEWLFRFAKFRLNRMDRCHTRPGYAVMYRVEKHETDTYLTLVILTATLEETLYFRALARGEPAKWIGRQSDVQFLLTGSLPQAVAAWTDLVQGRI